jgi:hypothetical protein
VLNTSVSSTEPVKNTWMPTGAGFFNIINGTIEILGGLTLIGAVELLSGIRNTWVGDTFFGLPLIIAGIVAVVGGIYSFRRRSWKLALAGAVCSLFLLHWTLTGIFSIILLFQSRKEFK